MAKPSDTKTPDKAARNIKLRRILIRTAPWLGGGTLILVACWILIALWQSSIENTAQLQARLDATEVKITALQSQQMPDPTAAIAEISARFEHQIGQLSDKIDTISQELARLDRMQHDIDGLRTQLNALGAQLGTFDETDQVTISAAQGDIAALRAQLAALREQVVLLQDQQPKTPTTTPPAVTPRETQSLDRLKRDFAPLAHQAIKADSFARAQTGTQKLSAWLRSQFSIRSLEPQEGDSTDAILSRMGAALARNDLLDVLAQAQKLDPKARDVLGDWLAQVQDYVTATSSGGTK